MVSKQSASQTMLLGQTCLFRPKEQYLRECSECSKNPYIFMGFQIYSINTLQFKVITRAGWSSNSKADIEHSLMTDF